MITITCEAPADDPVRCNGCGSSITDSEVIERREAGGPLSCCPERKPLTIDQWRKRAWAMEAQLRRAGMVPETVWREG